MSNILSRASVSGILNAFKVLISFATAIVIARGLGAEDYGVFAFLVASFSALRSLLDMGSSQAFFTFVSKYRRPSKFFHYYFLWLLTQFFLSLVFILIIAPDNWINNIWQGENRSRVFLAFLAVFLQQTIWTAITHIAESQRLTIRLQQTNLCIAVFHLALIILLTTTRHLSIEFVFILIAIEFLFTTYLAYCYQSISFSQTKISFKETFTEYKKYCLPLIPFIWASMLSVFANAWLLQNFSGSTQQAYYAVAVQFSTISFLLVTPVFNILWKEASEANQQKNFKKLQLIYSRICRVTFLLPAIIAGFSIPWALEIIDIFLGEDYILAAIPMKIMFVYGLWQCLGAVNISMFYALEFTTSRTVIGIIFAIISLPITYLVLASEDSTISGLDMGATGLAIKMTILSFISINIYNWWISRKMRWKLDISYQFIVALSSISLGYFVYYSINSILFTDFNNLLKLLIGFISYLILILLLLLNKPSLLGMHIRDIKSVQKIVKARLSQ
tara:strand:+ start:57 stop:1565 length:1509 start_codon:yes stop_codon:yes gene_type:complete